MFPLAVSFGMGQVFERMEAAIANALEGTPWLEWLPMRELELQPMLPLSEMVCIALGLMLPCLLAYTVLRSWSQRLFMGAVGLLLGVLASSLWADARLGLDRAARAQGLVAGSAGAGGLAACPCAAVPGAHAGGGGVATELAQPGFGQRLFRADDAKLGARPLHPLSWPDPVAGLVVAFCPVGAPGAPALAAAGLSGAFRIGA